MAVNGSKVRTTQLEGAEERTEALPDAQVEAPTEEQRWPDAEGRRPAEYWAAQMGTPLLHLRMARTLHGWGIGRPVTQTDYEDAITAALSVTVR